MKPLIHPKLVNGPFEDPGLYVDLLWERRALLLDMGDLTALGLRQLHRVSDAFLSHGHMDHFIGFDRLLRTVLRRKRPLHLYGPEGTLSRVEGRLKGYAWNLTDDYPLVLHVHEVLPESILSATFAAVDAFRRGLTISKANAGLLLAEPMLTLRAVQLDHRIPCLGFSVEERFHINIRKDRLQALGLPVGPWLRGFKEKIWAGASEEIPISVPGAHGDRVFRLGELKRQIAALSRGQKVAYVVDAAFSAENEARIVAIAGNADVFFCEAAYLDKDRHLAAKRAHLTARQAGWLARRAGVRHLEVLHVSPRYLDRLEEIHREAEAAFRG